MSHIPTCILCVLNSYTEGEGSGRKHLQSSAPANSPSRGPEKWHQMQTIPLLQRRKGSKYPISKVSGLKSHSGYGVCNQKPQVFGNWTNWTLWDRYIGGCRPGRLFWLRHPAPPILSPPIQGPSTQVLATACVDCHQTYLNLYLDLYSKGSGTPVEVTNSAPY